VDVGDDDNGDHGENGDDQDGGKSASGHSKGKGLDVQHDASFLTGWIRL
jgi:hypothetical protein